MAQASDILKMGGMEQFYRSSGITQCVFMGVNNFVGIKTHTDIDDELREDYHRLRISTLLKIPDMENQN